MVVVGGFLFLSLNGYFFFFLSLDHDFLSYVCLSDASLGLGCHVYISGDEKLHCTYANYLTSQFPFVQVPGMVL